METNHPSIQKKSGKTAGLFLLIISIRSGLVTYLPALIDGQVLHDGLSVLIQPAVKGETGAAFGSHRGSGRFIGYSLTKLRTSFSIV